MMDQNLSSTAVHDLEEVLRTKIYPGTEIMKDVGAYHFAKTDGGDCHTVLIPQPSDDPHDPLNWSPLWKGLTIFCATAISFSFNIGPLSLAPMFGLYMDEWNRDLADVVQFTGVAILCLGFSNFIWVPMMVCFGRRPVAILSTVICVCSAIWRARATSYDSFMGACILNGIGAGPSETLMPQVIVDVVFLHDRGKYQTLYFSMYFISLIIAPVIAGSMAEHLGWRSFWWLYTALLIFTLVCNIVFFPETRFRRSAIVSNTTEARDSPPANASEQGNSSETTNEKGTTPSSSNTKAHMDIASNPLSTHPVTNTATASDTTPSSTEPSPTPSTPAIPTGHGHPSRPQFSLLPQPPLGSLQCLLRQLYLPLYLHCFPILEFAAFAVSWSASGYLVVNLSQTQAFGTPLSAGGAYGYSAGTIGLFNLSLFVGGMLGLVTCGPLSDWVADVLTRRNGGVREPEMRLLAAVPYVCVMVVGSVVTAVGYDAAWPWQVVVVVGYGALGMQVAAIPAVVSTYAVDSYKPVTGSIFVMVTVNKNLWGYGLSKFLTPWAAESGFKAPILVNMALTVVFCGCGVIFWFYGKRFRGMTAKSFVHKED